MSLGPRWTLLVLLTIAGCATERLMVPEDDWQTVPVAQRTKLDRQHEADLTAARTELAAATTGLAAAQHVQPAAVAAPPAPRGKPPAPPPGAGDDWAAVMNDHEHARGAAFSRVEAARAEWLRTDLAWSQLRLDTARARLDMVVCEREVMRARTIDRNLMEGESYDSAPLRGQFSQAQRQWYALDQRARVARAAFDRAGATLASAKEAYAQVMRNGLPQLRSQPAFASAADERASRLELTSWAVTRSDIRRRRGLRHFLDDAAVAPPGLRKAKLQLATRTVVLAPPAPEVVAPAAKPAEPAKAASAAPIARPAPAPIARPAEPPRAASAAPVARPAPAPVARPVEPPRAAIMAPVARPAPAPVAKPVEPPRTEASTIARPVEPARPAPVAKPVERAPLFPSPTSAKPVESAETSSR